jgi:hypothetical protein
MTNMTTNTGRADLQFYVGYETWSGLEFHLLRVLTLSKIGKKKICVRFGWSSYLRPIACKAAT